MIIKKFIAKKKWQRAKKRFNDALEALRKCDLKDHQRTYNAALDAEEAARTAWAEYWKLQYQVK